MDDEQIEKMWNDLKPLLQDGAWHSVNIRYGSMLDNLVQQDRIEKRFNETKLMFDIRMVRT